MEAPGVLGYQANQVPGGFRLVRPDGVLERSVLCQSARAFATLHEGLCHFVSHGDAVTLGPATIASGQVNAILAPTPRNLPGRVLAMQRMPQVMSVLPDESFTNR